MLYLISNRVSNFLLKFSFSLASHFLKTRHSDSVKYILRRIHRLEHSLVMSFKLFFLEEILILHVFSHVRFDFLELLLHINFFGFSLFIDSSIEVFVQVS